MVYSAAHLASSKQMCCGALTFLAEVQASELASGLSMRLRTRSDMRLGPLQLDLARPSQVGCCTLDLRCECFEKGRPQVALYFPSAHPDSRRRILPACAQRADEAGTEATRIPCAAYWGCLTWSQVAGKQLASNLDTTSASYSQPIVNRACTLSHRIVSARLWQVCQSSGSLQTCQCHWSLHMVLMQGCSTWHFVRIDSALYHSFDGVNCRHGFG